MTLLQINASTGAKEALALTSFTITPLFRASESKDGAAVSGITPVIVTVSELAGTFAYTISQAESASATVGKTYWFGVYVNHAIHTSGVDVLYRHGIVRVPA